jgi:hypothetical protein
MKLTIDNFQKLHSISGLDESELDKTKRIIQVLLGKDLEYIEAMPIKKFGKLCDQIKNLFDLEIDAAIASKPDKLIKANGNWYRLNFEIKRPFNTGRYIEVLTFSKNDPIMDMHNILASICTPTKWSWKNMRLIDQPYDVLDHEKYSDDFKHADFKHGYHAMVFFCTLLASLTNNTKGYLAEEMLKLTKSQKDQQQSKINFRMTLDGFTTREK